MTYHIRPNPAGGPATITATLDLEKEVRRVLEEAHTGRGQHPHYLSSYQIESRLDSHTQRYLRSTYGTSGRHAGQHHSAAAIISRAAQSLVDQGIAEKEYLDTDGLRFIIDGQEIEAGFVVCALFRIKRP